MAIRSVLVRHLAGFVCGLLLFLAVPAAPQAAAGQSVDIEPVRSLIEGLIRDTGIASIAVSVARNGEILWEEGFGWADRERQIHANAHTPYSLASISKPITATAILLLAERGALDLDAPANRYLPPAGQIRSYEGNASEVTVRRLLSHTAGLPLHYQFFYEGDGAGEGMPSIDTSIHRYAVALHRPGARYIYSNMGYGVLNRIVEVVSGQHFGDFVQTEILAPLGMHRSSLDIRPGLDPYAAARYGNQQERIPFYTFDHPGASAFYASAHDLVRFGLFHLGTPMADQRRIFGEETRLRMQQLETPAGSPRGYGLGWIVSDDHGGFRQFGHSGGMPGVSTQLQIFPDAGVVLSVVTNGLPGRAHVVAEAIARAVLPGFELPVAATPAQASFQPGPLLGTWEGVIETWDRQIPVHMEVHGAGDIRIRLENGLMTLVNAPTLEGGVFRGEFAATLPSPDMALRPHTVLLELSLDTARTGPRLFGSATARSTTDPIHFALSSRMEMRRVAGGPGQN